MCPSRTSLLSSPLPPRDDSLEFLSPLSRGFYSLVCPAGGHIPQAGPVSDLSLPRGWCESEPVGRAKAELHGCEERMLRILLLEQAHERCVGGKGHRGKWDRRGESLSLGCEELHC